MHQGPDSGNITTYKGQFMFDKKVTHVHKTAYSYIDTLAASGGLLTGLFYAIWPLALTFSRLSFEVGVIGLLFNVKTMRNRTDDDALSRP